MTVYFAKSLDRPVDIFGLKGKWLTVFLVFAGASVLLALIAGAATTSGIGISCAIIGVACSFFGCMVKQGSVSHRQLAKSKASSSIYSFVSRRETLSRILLPDPRRLPDKEKKMEGLS